MHDESGVRILGTPTSVQKLIEVLQKAMEWGAAEVEIEDSGGEETIIRVCVLISDDERRIASHNARLPHGYPRDDNRTGSGNQAWTTSKLFDSLQFNDRVIRQQEKEKRGPTAREAIYAIGNLEVAQKSGRITFSKGEKRKFAELTTALNALDPNSPAQNVLGGKEPEAKFLLMLESLQIKWNQ